MLSLLINVNRLYNSFSIIKVESISDTREFNNILGIINILPNFLSMMFANDNELERQNNFAVCTSLPQKVANLNFYFIFKHFH